MESILIIDDEIQIRRLLEITLSVNGYKIIENYNCFGCSPDNKIGLKMVFIDNDDYVESIWTPSADFEGYHNVVHGGIQATLMDEIANWVLISKLHATGVTKTMRVNYLKSVFVNNGDILIRAKVVSFENSTASVFAEILDSDGVIRANAEIEYFVFPDNVARKRFNFPGVDAFYLKNID